MPISSTKKYILNLPRPIKRILAVLLDIFICALSVWLAFGLRIAEWDFFYGARWIPLFVAYIVAAPLFFIYGLYRAIFRYIGSVTLLSMVRAFLGYACIYILIFTIITVEGVPRSIGVIQPLLLIFGIGISRMVIGRWLGSINNVQKTVNYERPIALIYGAGSAGRKLAAGLSINKEVDVRGFIDDDRKLHGNTINGVAVYGTTNMRSLIFELEITDVLLAIPSVDQARRNEIINSLEGCGVRVRTLPGLTDMASGRVRISDLHDLDMNDLLGRKVVPPNVALLEKNIRNMNVLITGAGGSIGSELCRQIIKYSPRSLVLVESSEYSLYSIYEELKKLLNEISELEEGVSQDFDEKDVARSEINLIPCLASVRDRELIKKIFTSYKPNTVFHAAAYKHVPLVEQNPSEGILNNVVGTLNCAEVSLETGVSHFTLISTDKAVRPTNVMGASKRISELVLQAMAEIAEKDGKEIKFSMVRFGNVLGSSGSVTPLFGGQIKAGGPITLTHTEVTRYFMTIPEAAQLVIQASSMASGGDVFVLDMGQPVRIYDLAAKMVHLSGLILMDDKHPQGDIEIKVVGLRPGEKLYEELLIGNNPQPTDHPKIMKAHEEFLSWDDLKLELGRLDLVLKAGDPECIRTALKRLLPEYQPNLK